MKMSDFRRVHLHAIGGDGQYGKNRREMNPREVAMWMAVEHVDKRALGLFSIEIAAAGAS